MQPGIVLIDPSGKVFSSALRLCVEDVRAVMQTQELDKSITLPKVRAY